MWRVCVALCIVCLGFARCASAEVVLSGTAEALRLEAREASLEDVLRALRTSFKFQYEGTAALDNIINGSYSGSLPRVVTHLLDGRNYVMRGTTGDLVVEIFGSGGAPKNRAVEAKPAPAKPMREPDKNCTYKDGDRIIPVEC